MKEVIEQIEKRWFVSDVDPAIRTPSEELAEAIAWADANPVAYEIVRSGRSKAFGKDSSFYPGYQRGPDVEALVGRLFRFYRVLTDRSEQKVARGLQTWSARFTFAHFKERRLTGGFFQQYARWTDGKEYSRDCWTLDYTRETLEHVIDRFWEWADGGEHRYENTTRITVDDEDVRRF
jgi:hypothetical protein